MMAALFGLALRQLMSRKSTIVLLLFAFLPVLLATVFRFGESTADPQRWTATVLLAGLVVRLMLPVIALFLGTSVLGNEIEDGTAIYLLTKPTPRWQIIAAKLAAAWLMTIGLLLPPLVLASQIALQGSGGSSIAPGFAVAVVAGALAYTTVFILTSLLTSRALVAGLAYVFIWEAVVSGIFTGTRVLSVRYLTLGIADAIVSSRPAVFDSNMDAVTSIAVLALATAALAGMAVRRLERFELREPT